MQELKSKYRQYILRLLKSQYKVPEKVFVKGRGA